MPRESKRRSDPLKRLETNNRQRQAEARRQWLENKNFIVWDGEGVTRQPGKPQDYVLFGCYNGAQHQRIISESLNTTECLEFILAQGRANPDGTHVGFAFGYDVDMILKSLTPKQFERLRDRGATRYGPKWRIEHIPGKWFRVTEHGDTWPMNRRDVFSVTIYDVWGFFQTSLVNALKTMIADDPLMVHIDEIEAGKKRRDSFTYAEIDYIEKYWSIENALVYAMVNHLRDMLYRTDLRITKWHGPGALASYVYSHNGIRKHKADCGSDVYNAARYAYAGGRFERFHVGKYDNAYGYDINSAYPYAISKLPSLTQGEWIHNASPVRFAEFGVYRISLRGAAIARNPSALFHRDQMGNISYPHRLDGWYWSPELKAIQAVSPDAAIHVYEGYEYVGWSVRPFAFVEDAYEERKRLKRAGDGAQMAYKLMLNSLYGKMAQRAGWERNGRAPQWHQLEWAGWVTSFTRAMLYELMARIPYDKLIAVETDGIYSTATPEYLGISDSRDLGGWEVSNYQELVYLQSGLYAKLDDNGWSLKFRGLDKDSVSVDSIRNHAKLLTPNSEWPALVGTTTRFIGYKNALFREAQNRGPMKVHHRVWQTEEREIDCGSVGKRVHSPKMCAACKAGLNAYEMPHETVIKSRTAITPDDDLMSAPHNIPWLNENKMVRWREMQRSQEGLLAPA